MKELDMMEVDSVNGGGVGKLVFDAIVGGVAYDLAKTAWDYAMKNSHMGKGNFPSVPRAGHE